MKVLPRLFACFVVLSPFAGQATAQSIDDDTKCRAVNAMMAASIASNGKSADIVTYIEKIMKDLDRAHGLRGKAEIFPQMTANGQSAVALVAIDRCRTHPDLTLADTAVETYEAVRAMQASLGMKKFNPKLARSEASRQPGLPLRGTLPATGSPSLARFFENL